MRKNLFLLFILLMSFSMFQACIYDNIEDSYTTPCSDTTGSISYSKQIVPIIENRCFPCHGPSGADGNLTVHSNFSQVKFRDNIVGNVNHAQGFNPMPKTGAKIPQCEIVKIEKWAAAGFPDN
jgi:hypothetical protein